MRAVANVQISFLTVLRRSYPGDVDVEARPPELGDLADAPNFTGAPEGTECPERAPA